LAIIQVQIQILLVGGVVGEATEGSNIEVAKPPVFNRETSKVIGFVIAYKLYLRMRMREALLKE